MTLWLLIPFLLIVAIAQTTLVPLVTVAGFKIEFPLILIVSQGLLGAPGSAARWGFIIGLFLDLASGLPFGIHAVGLTVVGFVMDLGQSISFGGNVLAPPVAMLAATLFYDTLILAILSLLNWPVTWGDYLPGIVLPTAVLNTAAMPLAYFPLRWIHRRTRRHLDV